MSITRITDRNARFDPKALAAEAKRPQRPRMSRRVLLQAAAASVALPSFESLTKPGEAKAQADVPQRLVAWHIGCGVWGPNWFPETTGADYELTSSLSPLEPIRDKVLVLSGIQNTEAVYFRGSHGCGPAGMTTCVQGTKPGVKMGISVDQVYAQALGDATRIPSLQLTVNDKTFADEGYPAVYNGTTSWASETQPLPPVVNPGLIFDKILSGSADADPADEAAAAEARTMRKALRMSVLDHVLGEADALKPRLGMSDRHKLDQYLTSVRTVEEDVERATDAPTVSCSVDTMERPDQTNDIPELTRIMLDLMVLAFTCDATRIITFMQGNGGNTSFRACPWLNISEDHHGLSHNGGNAEKGAKLSAIDQWEVEQYAYFLQKLDQVQEGEGTALDNSLIFLSSEISDGNRHNQENKPILLAGTAGGKIITGVHANFEGEPQPDLFIALLNLLGVPITKFGTAGTKPLAGITV